MFQCFIRSESNIFHLLMANINQPPTIENGHLLVSLGAGISRFLKCVWSWVQIHVVLQILNHNATTFGFLMKAWKCTPPSPPELVSCISDPYRSARYHMQKKKMTLNNIPVSLVAKLCPSDTHYHFC